MKEFIDSLEGAADVKADQQFAFVYDKQDQEITIPNVTLLNMAAVAKVCDTDQQTIDLVLREIVAQIRKHVCSCQNIRLQFKVGNLIVKNGEIQWKTLQDNPYKTES